MLLNLGAIRAGYGIVGVAAMTTATFFFYFSISYFTVISKLVGASRAFKDYAVYISCFLYLLLSIMTANFLVNQFGTLTWMRLSIHAGAAAFFLSPLLFQLNSQFGLLNVIMKRWVRKPLTGKL